MIVDFTIQNFRSIKDEAILSLTTSNTLSSSKVVSVTQETTQIIEISDENFDLLNSAVVYGANASGKSNIILAILYLKQFIINSTDIKLGHNIPFYEPFCLDTFCSIEPTIFEIEFIINVKRYLYKIEFNGKIVVYESLIFNEKNKEVVLFERKLQKITFDKKLKGKKANLVEQLLENNLFLTKGANNNIPILKEVYLYFLNNITVEFNVSTDDNFLKNILVQTNIITLNEENLNINKSRIEKFLKSADTGISEVDFRKVYVNDNITNKVKFEPILYHKLFENEKFIGNVEFKLNQESKGTIKMFDLALMVLDVLENGKILVIDELDTSFHPLLTEYIINLFNDKNFNKNNSQLIFTTHETSLLNLINFREDQIWFMEKNKFGNSVMFSLAEFDSKDVQNAISLQNWYLNGRFGGLPSIDKLELYEVQ